MTTTTLQTVRFAAPARPGPIARLTAAVTRYRASRRDMSRLREMPDYLLADVGLTRDQIRHAVLTGRTR